MAQITLELLANSSEILSWEVPLYVHVHNRVEQFVYLDKIRDGAAPIAYIENQQLDSHRNLHVVNRSYQIPGNSISKIYQQASWDKTTSSSYSSIYKDLFITNRTYIDENGKTQPLFFKHVLPENTFSVKLQMVSAGERQAVQSGYSFTSLDSALYTNYQNFFDPDTGAYKLFFVHSVDTSGNSTHVLLNPESAVTEGTWEDIDLDTGDWKEGRIVYNKTTSSGTTYYFSESGTYYTKPKDTSLIIPKLPYGREPIDPWYMRFTAGEITTSVNGAARRYYVPEYELQNFFPSKPYVYFPEASFMYVNERVIAANRGHLKIDPTAGLHVELYIYDVDGILIRALSTNTGLEGARYSNTEIFYETDKILSWDEDSGKIALGIKVLPSWSISGNTFYEADDYQYTSIDLNPLANKTLLDQTVVFYLVPGVDSEDSAIHHLVVDRSGVITACSQGEGFAHSSLKLLFDDGSYNNSTVIGMPYISGDINEDTFVTLYTAGADNANGYCILAEVSFLDRNFPEDQIVYDVRREGAIISPSAFDDVIKANPKILQSVLGYGEFGEEIPRNGVVTFNVPITVLSDYGGDLSEADVKKLITQHLDSAVYPLIKYDYPVSEVDVDATVTEELTLSWTWEGPNQTYELLRRANPTDAWEVIHTLIAPPRGTLTHTDSGLDVNAVYYYTVRITENDIVFPNGNSVAARVRA